MEPSVISDESNDVDLKTMRDQLSEYGLEEDNLTKEEMHDLLIALNNSKSSVKEEELLRQKVEEPSRLALSADKCLKHNNKNVGEPSRTVQSADKCLKRNYKNVKDRRMPWSLLPNNLSNAEKARVLAVYIKIMSISRYKQARQTAKFATWPPPLQIVEENSRVHSLRSTRSGRSVPSYCGDMDDDSSDTDFAIVKNKKRKISDPDLTDGVYTNKVMSLKRKSKEEQHRPIKELKSGSNDFKIEASSSGSLKIYSMIED